jgi:chromosome segregation protein
MFNIKRYLNKDMNTEIEDTILNDTKQMNKLYEKIDSLEMIITNKDIEIKNIYDENELLKQKIIMLEEIINNKDNYKRKEFNVKIDDLPSDESELESDSENTINNLKIKENKEYKKVLNELKEIKSKYNDIKEDYVKIQNKNKEPIESNEQFLNLKSKYDEILYEKELKENNIEKKQDEINKLNDTINKLKDEKSKFDYSSSTQTKANKKYTDHVKEKQKNKSLPMLERYPIKIYNKISNNLNEVITFMTSENKIIIEFNSKIANKMEDTNIDKDKLLKDRKIWNDIFNSLVEIGEITNNSAEKTKLKYKILRCSELYEKYQENLSRFKIPLSYIEEISEKEWSKWLEEFDIVYKNVFRDKFPCSHIYKNGKSCSIIGCEKKHR